MIALIDGLVVYIAANVPSAGNAYPQAVPQGQTGWAYSVVDDAQEIGHGGGQKLYKARLQVDLQYPASTSKSAYRVSHEIAEAMRAVLDGYRGPMGSANVHFCKTETTDDWANIAQTSSVRFDILINYKL